jgi:hypothetical protein
LLESRDASGWCVEAEGVSPLAVGGAADGGADADGPVLRSQDIAPMLWAEEPRGHDVFGTAVTRGKILPRAAGIAGRPGATVRVAAVGVGVREEAAGDLVACVPLRRVLQASV